MLELAKGARISVVQTAKLLFLDSDGYPAVANERYLVSFSPRGYPVIEDLIVGHTVSLQLEDLNGDGQPELLVFFHAGGAQTLVRLSEVSPDALVLFADQPIASNMGSIRIANGEIVVQNETSIPGDAVFIETRHYALHGEKLVLSASSSERHERK